LFYSSRNIWSGSTLVAKYAGRTLAM